MLALGAGPAIAGSWIVWIAFDSADIVQPRLEQVVRALLSGLAFIAFVRALIDAILAPDHTSWRLIPVRDASATRIMSFSVTLATIMVIGKVIEAFNTAIAAALPITVITRAIFALAVALVFAELLRRFAARENQDEACLGPYVAQDVDIGGPSRSFGWFLVALIVGSVLGGYVALASFLIDQAVCVLIIVALWSWALHLRTSSSAAPCAARPSSRRRSRPIRSLPCLPRADRRSGQRHRKTASHRLGVLRRWRRGASNRPMSRAPCGDVSGSMSARRHHLPSSILFAALLFAAAFAVTRDDPALAPSNTFLPSTELDAGLRIRSGMAAGYVGIITAGTLAISASGLAWSGRPSSPVPCRSVSVPEPAIHRRRFIWGLILRQAPIRVGDLVVVGDGEGYVRRIDVRSTE